MKIQNIKNIILKELVVLTFLFVVLNSCNEKEKKDAIFDGTPQVSSSYKLDYKDLYSYEKVGANGTTTFFDSTESYSIKYKSEGLNIHAYLVKPKYIEKPLPLVIYCRGGNRDIGETTDETALYLAGMVSNGYVVLASNYGGSSKSDGVDEFGGKEVRDVINLFALAKEFPFIDTTNILLYGESRGGMMVYQTLKDQRENKNIKAAVILAGITDLELVFYNRPEMERLGRVLISNYDANKVDELYRRSVVKWVEELPKHVPILLLHGDADKRVNVEHSIKLATQLKANNHSYGLKIYKDEGHRFSSVYSDSAIIEREIWFQQYITE